MIRTVTAEDLGPPCVEAGHTNGVLDCFGPRIREKYEFETLGSMVRDQPGGFTAHVVGVLRSDSAEPISLLLDSGNDSRVLVTNIGIHQLRGKVEVLVTVVVIDVGALSTSNRHR